MRDRISFENTSHERGAVPAAGDTAHATNVLSRRPHVLVVEDHDAVREVIVRTLHKISVATIEAMSAEEARMRFSASWLDAAIVDVALPGGNGLDLGEWMRRRLPMLPIIYISGLSEQEMPGPLPRDNLSRFIRKPFGARVIIDFVTNLLAKTAGHADLSSL